MNWVFIIHALFIVGFIITPFLTNDPMMLLLHIIIGFGIIVHWLLNSNMCVVTLLEHKLFNTPIDQTFTNRLIGKFFDIKDFHIQFVTYFCLTFSIIKLYVLYKNNQFIIFSKEV